MHEAGAVGRAIEPVIHDWPAHRSGHLELKILDATRAEAFSVAFFATAILAEHGLEDVTVAVSTAAVTCVLCGADATSASPSAPHCDACGAPLPQVAGPAVVCREASPCA